MTPIRSVIFIKRARPLSSFVTSVGQPARRRPPADQLMFIGGLSAYAVHSAARPPAGQPPVCRAGQPPVSAGRAAAASNRSTVVARLHAAVPQLATINQTCPSLMDRLAPSTADVDGAIGLRN